MSAEATVSSLKPRVKRSWSRVTVKLGGMEFTFWATPEGLHRRRKGSPNVRTEPWDKVHDALNDHRIHFEFDNRHYTAWGAPEGLHIRRNSTEEKLIEWPKFIEWMDGQKLLPI